MDTDWPRLIRLAEQEWRRLRDSLPPALRERFDAVPVLMEEFPSDELLDDGVADDTMGLFEGPAFAEESADALPPRMTLFLLNIWEEADHEERAFRREVRVTLLHELGHYLGLNEDELADRELD